MTMSVVIAPPSLASATAAAAAAAAALRQDKWARVTAPPTHGRDVGVVREGLGKGVDVVEIDLVLPRRGGPWRRCDVK